MRRARASFVALLALGAMLVFVASAAAATNLNLLPGTAVLLSKSGSGPLSSTSSSTDSFSPAAYADYKHLGGEPTVVVGHYPITSGTFKGKTCSSGSPCYPDYAYACSPQGFVEPHYSTFLSDLGESFRVTNHFPASDLEQFNAGGGDSA
jgi:hypothetical protein